MDYTPTPFKTITYQLELKSCNGSDISIINCFNLTMYFSYISYSCFYKTVEMHILASQRVVFVTPLLDLYQYMVDQRTYLKDFAWKGFIFTSFFIVCVDFIIYFASHITFITSYLILLQTQLSLLHIEFRITAYSDYIYAGYLTTMLFFSDDENHKVLFLNLLTTLLGNSRIQIIVVDDHWQVFA